MEWQPISEAKPGTYLLYFPEEAGRNAKPALYKVDFYPVHYPRQPSYFQPLPAPPAVAKE